MTMTNIARIRVRFAPSPTGFLHVGGLRTALYNYLFARKEGGAFILRIEDTDRSRYVEGAVANLIETFRWAGLEYDEGPSKGGEYGPYVQSERLDVYKHHVEQLLQGGTAYRCFCPPARLEEMRKQQEKMKVSPKYDRRCLSLSQREIEESLMNKVPSVVRMKVPDATAIRFQDIIRGEIEFASESLDDQVLMKSDGYPTYHLANTVDDHLMRITHVIRGEEWLSSTPKHVLLYQSFNWQLPVFAHLPLLLNSDRSKLSKRQGDVSVEDYRAKGYLKEALINFVALLGWNPGTEQEVFSMDELIHQFSLDRVNKTGAIFSVEKLDWINFEHLRKKPDEEVLNMLKNELAHSEYNNHTYDDAYLLNVVRAMRDRISFVKDVIDKSPYFFAPPATYDTDVVKKRWEKETPDQLKILAEEFAALENPGKQEYEAALRRTAERLQIADGKLIHALRLAVSGVGGGPGVFDIVFILGTDECVKRIHNANERIAK
ncbi:MAG TPA: glutamate--tRNA ligase [Bacteroidota bacterium]|nr:glutamate--tRNA ligase [Bacteroidota bacterium]